MGKDCLLVTDKRVPRARPIRSWCGTESDWAAVFEARCLSKRGLPLSPEQRKLVEAAYKADPERYGSMEGDVFDATVPFGSNVRWGSRTRKTGKTEKTKRSKEKP